MKRKDLESKLLEELKVNYDIDKIDNPLVCLEAIGFIELMNIVSPYLESDFDTLISLYLEAMRHLPGCNYVPVRNVPKRARKDAINPIERETLQFWKENYAIKVNKSVCAEAIGFIKGCMIALPKHKSDFYAVIDRYLLILITLQR